MTTLLLTILPSVIGFALMFRRLSRTKEIIPMVTMPVLIMATAVQMIVVMKEYGGTTPQGYLLFTRNVFVCAAIPAAFVYVCSKCGNKRKERTLIAMATAVVLMFTNGFELQLGSRITEPRHFDGGVHIIYEGVEMASMKVVELVMLLQFVALCVWANKLYYSQEKEDIRLSHKEKRFAAAILVALLLTFVALVVPNTWWKGSIALPCLFFTAISVCITTVEVMEYLDWLGTATVEAEAQQTVPSIDDSQLFPAIREYVEDREMYLKSDLRITDLARELGTNRTYISQAINKYAGTNFSGYINQLRIAKAKSMIYEDPTISMELVATECGFTQGSTFTKVFKRMVGVNPSEAKKDRKAFEQYFKADTINK